jgi:hypothetical protein
MPNLFRPISKAGFSFCSRNRIFLFEKTSLFAAKLLVVVGSYESLQLMSMFGLLHRMLVCMLQ